MTDTRVLYEILERRFNLTDLHSLAFDCGWDYETIGTNHHVKGTFIRNLIDYAQRRSQLPKLMQAAAKANSALVFDGVKLTERDGYTYTPSASPPAPPEPDPRETRKRKIIANLRSGDEYALYEALIYLLEAAP